MHISLLLAACLVSAASTLLGTAVILRTRGRWGLVARTDGRAIGGPALVCGVILATVSIARIDIPLIIAACLIALVGFVDDLIDLSPGQKLIGQGIAAALVAAWLASWTQSPLVGIGSFLWIVLLTNAVNLIDGLDGLLIGTIIPGMIALVLISVSVNDPATAAFAASCTAALVVFLPFNWAHARFLLGDTGSEFIGFSLSVICLILFLHRPNASSIPVFFLIAAIPLADTAFAIIRRSINHRSIFAGDKGHIHHRLARHLGERRSVVFLSLLSALASAAAYLLWQVEM